MVSSRRQTLRGALLFWEAVQVHRGLLSCLSLISQLPERVSHQVERAQMLLSQFIDC